MVHPLRSCRPHCPRGVLSRLRSCRPHCPRRVLRRLRSSMPYCPRVVLRRLRRSLQRRRRRLLMRKHLRMLRAAVLRHIIQAHLQRHPQSFGWPDDCQASGFPGFALPNIRTAACGVIDELLLGLRQRTNAARQLNRAKERSRVHHGRMSHEWNCRRALRTPCGSIAGEPCGRRDRKVIL